jgi:hypothetical protein
MIDSATLEELNNTSIEERITIIEILLGTLKNDIKQDSLSSHHSVVKSPRPAFGFMKDTGKILGDVVTPILPENTWEVLQ